MVKRQPGNRLNPLHRKKKTPDVSTSPVSAQKTAPEKTEAPKQETPAPPPISTSPIVQAEGPEEDFEDTPEEDFSEYEMDSEPDDQFEEPEILEEPDLSDIEPPLAENPQTSTLRKPKNGSLPTLQSLDSLHAEIEEAESNRGPQKAAKLSQEDLEDAWTSYIESIDKDSVKTILKGATISMEGTQVNAVVGSALAESIIRQETGLMEFLRNKLHVPLLSLNLKLDPTRPNAAPAKPKRLTETEKYWSMVAANPLVAEVRKRFDLNFENE